MVAPREWGLNYQLAGPAAVRVGNRDKERNDVGRRYGLETAFTDFRRFVRIAVVVGVAVTMVPACAQAADTVALTGSGSGTVQGGKSPNPPNEINCTNVGEPGGPGSGTCSAAFTGIFPTIDLVATAAPGSEFTGWSGNALVEPSLGIESTCNSGSENPCHFKSAGGSYATTITANFDLLPPVDPPTVSTGGVSGVDFSTATLEGSLNPEGAEVETCRFEYGKTTEYGGMIPCRPAVLGEGVEISPVRGRAAALIPSTVYHYRLVASNSGGTAQGADRTFMTAPMPVQGCPNEAIRRQQGVELLPKCMAFEQVSPIDKSGVGVVGPTAIAPDGERIAFLSRGALADTPGLLHPPFEADAYLTSRGPAGWLTSATTPPGNYGFGYGGVGNADAFSPALDRWVSRQATVAQSTRGWMTVFEGSLGSGWTPRSPLLAPVVGGGDLFNISEAQILGSSADLSRLILRPGRGSDLSGLRPSYLAADPRPDYSSATAMNAYLLSRDDGGQPSIALLARDSSGKAWGGTCGAWLGGGEFKAAPGGRNQGAISLNGLRIYFSTRPAQPQPESEHPSNPACSASNPIRILKRTESASGVQISELIPGGPSSGDDFFEGASVDGTKVYFTASRALVASDHDSYNVCQGLGAPYGCDLYLYDSRRPEGERVIQVSRGEDNAQHVAGAEANVFKGVTAISGDGSHVYFAAQGVLTEMPNSEGRIAEAGKPNLYAWDADTETTRFIGTLAAADGSGTENTLFGSGIGFNGTSEAVPLLGRDVEGDQVGGNGHILVFRSHASLTADDADAGHVDTYRFDSISEELQCISCAPGRVDDAPVDVKDPTGGGARIAEADFADHARWVSEDGQTIAVPTEETLVPGVAGAFGGNYLWWSGHLVALPGLGAMAVSHDGREVAFNTASSLVPRDGDSISDVYVARADGGFPNPSAEPDCQGAACQGLPGVTLPEADIATSGFHGRGNLRAHGMARCSTVVRRAKRLTRRARRLRAQVRRSSARRQRGRERRARRLLHAAHREHRRASECRRRRGGRGR